MKGIAARYPSFDPARGRPVNLEQRINICRSARSSTGFASKYTLHFDKGATPPVNALWSVTPVAAAAAQPNAGIFIPLDVTIAAFTEQTVAVVARHRLPAIYSEREFVTKGGLVYYGADRIQLYRGAASYVDRILRGEKPGDLPFQQPTKYELVINLQTAKAMGLTIPPKLLFTADDVIE